MKTFFKVSGIVLGLAMVVLLVTPFLIPKQVYLDWAIREIESQYPVKLRVQDADLVFLPGPQLTLRGINVQLQNEEGELAEVVQADSIGLSASWGFIRDRSAALSSFRRLDIEGATFTYPPFDEKPKTYSIEHLIVTGINYSAKKLRAVIDIKGGFDKLRVDGTLKLSGQHQRKDQKTTGTMELTSKQLTFAYSDIISFQKQNFSLTADFTHRPEMTEFKKGRLQLGPQVLSVRAERKPGLITIWFKADPAQVAYLQGILPVLAKIPPMQGAKADGSFLIRTKNGTRLTISGNVIAQELKLSEVPLENVSSDITYQDRQLKLEHIKAEVLGGTAHGSGQLDFASHPTAYHADIGLRKIAVEKIGDVGHMMSGRADLNLRARGKGFTMETLKQYLSGSGDIDIRQIQLKKLKFFEKLTALESWNPLTSIPGAINKNAFDRTKKLDQEVKRIGGKFTIGKGAVTFSNVKFDFPDAFVAMSGPIGFDGTMNFEGTLYLRKNLMDSLITIPTMRQAAARDKEGFKVPFTITGTTNEPKIDYDLELLNNTFESIATLPMRAVGGILTLPMRLITPRSHEKRRQEREGAVPAEEEQEEDTPVKKRRPPGSPTRR